MNMMHKPAPPGERGPPPPLKRSTKLAYGVGSVALGLKDNGFSYLLLLFYNQVVGLPAPTVGLAIMIALVADAILDPIIGQVSDNWRSRWGRRHPFMYMAAGPIAISYLLLWHPPLGWSDEALFYYLIATAMIIRTFLAMFEIPSAALAAELTQDYHERTSLAAWRAAFNWYGGLIMVLLTFRVFLQPSAEHPVAQLNPDGYATYGIFASVTMFAVILISAVGTHSRIPWLRQPPAKKPPFVRALRDMFSAMVTPALLPMLGAGLFNAMAYGLSVALGLYFNTYFWGFSAAQISLFIMVQFGSSALAIWLAAPLSHHLGKRNAAILCKLLVPIFGLTPIALRLAGVFPENGSPALLPIMMTTHLISVTCASIVAILLGSMGADVVEDHELRSGRRAEGVMAAAGIFVAKTTSGVGIFASSALLAFVGFPEGANPETLDPSIVRNLALVFAPAMALLHGCAILCILRYRITRESHAETLAELARRRAEAER
ncbi:MFS transporter [Sphingomonas canadensis]|uniref:MFS transporter n=1 Tax=Sphingomonas canadensis TaxID=1219257 RepID=A0ABW3HB82_9SPHN|nr:MFS transporter [Sphingomonas canadensis]MCW3838353.1 MFS transporter [Sphingomonas canadensis]